MSANSLPTALAAAFMSPCALLPRLAPCIFAAVGETYTCARLSNTSLEINYNGIALTQYM